MSPIVRRKTGAKEPQRMQVLVDTNGILTPGAILRFSRGAVLLTCELQLRPGQELTLVPLVDDMDAALFELHGQVTNTFQDVMTSAYADDRWLMCVSLDPDENLERAFNAFFSGKNKAFAEGSTANDVRWDSIMDSAVWHRR